MLTPFHLTGKKILVTGSSSGIGRQIAIELSKMGAQLIVTGRDEFRLEETYHMLEGNQHEKFIADLTDENNISELVKDITILDGVVFAAGIFKLIPFKMIKNKDIEDIYKVNLFSVMALMKILINEKKIAKNSSIVFISSISALKATKANSIYATTKAALITLAKSLALELASPHRIRVNCIAPGMVSTPLLQEAINVLSEDTINEDKKKYPLGYGEPIDVANAVIYLVSDASKWVTGSTMIIDGGYTLQ